MMHTENGLVKDKKEGYSLLKICNNKNYFKGELLCLLLVKE